MPMIDCPGPGCQCGIVGDTYGGRTCAYCNGTSRVPDDFFPEDSEELPMPRELNFVEPYAEERETAVLVQLAGTMEGRLGLKLRTESGKDIAVFLDRHDADLLAEDIPKILATMDKRRMSELRDPDEEPEEVSDE